nr:DegT/DnrJ/EryC1/StrS family aminotransferase [Planococcus beigongshangi]
MPPLDEYIEEIRDLWDSRWLTNSGVKHNGLADALSRYLNVPYTALFTNGHLALENAIAAFDLTGEVITTPFTFISTTHAIVRNGLEPVFCDIESDHFTMDPAKLESLITDRTSAIVPVHVYGHLCDVIEIERIAKKYNLKVIYDAAHAFGSAAKGIGAGNFGDASMFSFHATKVFHTIEGGAVTSKDPQLIERLNYLKNFGINDDGGVESIGGNSKMNEFQAAMGLCNLRYVEDSILKRKMIFERYTENLKGIQGIRLPQAQKDVKPNYAYYPVVFEDYKYNRDEIYKKLADENIFARKYFAPLTNQMVCYQGQYTEAVTPNAEYISERVLTLPLYAELSLETVDEICMSIKR